MKVVLSPSGAVAVAIYCMQLLVAPVRGESSFSLSEEVLEISYEAAKLSNLTYRSEDALNNYGEREEISGAEAFITHFTHPDFEEFDYIKFYTQEPDQALVAKKGERCFVAFRGTRGSSFPDWLQNLDINDRIVHRNNDTNQEGCEVRKGYVDFLDSVAVERGVADIVDCLESTSCDDTNGACLIITGHSQGGASATVASILLYDFDPTVVTFGQPAAVDEDCDSIPSDRYYRYVNSIKEPNEIGEQAFDPVPYVPPAVSRSVHYGHCILLGEDPTSVKYLGLDVGADFKPSVFDRRPEKLSAHFGYDVRIGALLENAPIRTDGFSDGIFCDRDYHDLCSSGWCAFNNTCSSKLSETCVPGSCKKDEDCESGACISESCAVAKGRVGGGCPCYTNLDCASGVCNMKITNLLGWTCEYGPDEEVIERDSAARFVSLHAVLYVVLTVSTILLVA